jgi:GMP synthase (glutamine-hydrolysing)
VLETGIVVEILVIEHETDAGLGNFEPWLREAGVEPVIVRPHKGDPIPARAGAGLIVLGGAVGAHDDDRAPWLPATRDLLRGSVADGTPVLGICLGAQLLTVACGGRVERGSAGPEIGVVTVRLSADPLFDGIADQADFVQWHSDAMTEPPPGAVPLAHGEMYPNQAYRLGERAWAVQFHPEVTLTDVTTWARHDAATLTGLGLDADSLIGEVRARQSGLLAGSGRLAANFAGIVLARPTTAG